MDGNKCSVDEFEPWLTFSPSQQPSTLGNSTSFVVPRDRPTTDLSLLTGITSSVENTCQSPSADHTGLVAPSSVSLQLASASIKVIKLSLVNMLTRLSWCLAFTRSNPTAVRKLHAKYQLRD